MAQDREAWQEFARLQRQYRTEQGLSQERLADKVAYSESAVGHVERLMRRPTEHYTREIEKALGLNGQLMELVPLIHGTMGPKWFREWPRVEALHAPHPNMGTHADTGPTTDGKLRRARCSEAGRGSPRRRSRTPYGSACTGRLFSPGPVRPCTRL